LNATAHLFWWFGAIEIFVFKIEMKALAAKRTRKLLKRGLGIKRERRKGDVGAKNLKRQLGK